MTSRTHRRPTPDGYYLLFMIGITNRSNIIDCSGGPHWNSTYVEDASNAIWRKPGPRNSPPATAPGNIEDPFAWTDARGNYHIVAHSQGTMTVCGGRTSKGKGGPGNACGVHLFADQARGPWTPSLTPVYTGTSGTFTMAPQSTLQRGSAHKSSLMLTAQLQSTWSTAGALTSSIKAPPRWSARSCSSSSSKPQDAASAPRSCLYFDRSSCVAAFPSLSIHHADLNHKVLEFFKSRGLKFLHLGFIIYVI